MTPVFSKYLSVTFFIALFLFKGVATILPSYAEYLFEQDYLEMQMNAETENTKEKSNEKEFEMKEFLGHFYDDNSSSTKYTILSKTSLLSRSQNELDVYLPIVTPPPRMID